MKKFDNKWELKKEINAFMIFSGVCCGSLVILALAICELLVFIFTGEFTFGILFSATTDLLLYGILSLSTLLLFYFSLNDLILSRKYILKLFEKVKK